MKPKRTRASRYRDRLRIERPVPDGSFAGAGSGSWALVAEVSGEVLDARPSRDERLANGLNSSARRARIEIRYREGVTSDMRFVIGTSVIDDTVDYSAARIMQIIAGPAELGNREAMEFMAEEYRPAGNTA